MSRDTSSPFPRVAAGAAGGVVGVDQGHRLGREVGPVGRRADGPGAGGEPLHQRGAVGRRLHGEGHVLALGRGELRLQQEAVAAPQPRAVVALHGADAVGLVVEPGPGDDDGVAGGQVGRHAPRRRDDAGTDVDGAGVLVAGHQRAPPLVGVAGGRGPPCEPGSHGRRIGVDGQHLGLAGGGPVVRRQGRPAPAGHGAQLRDAVRGRLHRERQVAPRRVRLDERRLQQEAAVAPQARVALDGADAVGPVLEARPGDDDGVALVEGRRRRRGRVRHEARLDGQGLAGVVERHQLAVPAVGGVRGLGDVGRRRRVGGDRLGLGRRLVRRRARGPRARPQGPHRVDAVGGRLDRERHVARVHRDELGVEQEPLAAPQPRVVGGAHGPHAGRAVAVARPGDADRVARLQPVVGRGRRHEARPDRQRPAGVVERNQLGVPVVGVAGGGPVAVPGPVGIDGRHRGRPVRGPMRRGDGRPGALHGRPQRGQLAGRTADRERQRLPGRVGGHEPRPEPEPVPRRQARPVVGRDGGDALGAVVRPRPRDQDAVTRLQPRDVQAVRRQDPRGDGQLARALVERDQLSEPLVRIVRIHSRSERHCGLRHRQRPHQHDPAPCPRRRGQTSQPPGPVRHAPLLDGSHDLLPKPSPDESDRACAERPAGRAAAPRFSAAAPRRRGRHSWRRRHPWTGATTRLSQATTARRSLRTVP